MSYEKPAGLFKDLPTPRLTRKSKFLKNLEKQQQEQQKASNVTDLCARRVK